MTQSSQEHSALIDFSKTAEREAKIPQDNARRGRIASAWTGCLIISKRSGQ